MLIVNADGHPVMKNFHNPNDENRSIVVLDDRDFISWLNADHAHAKDLLKVAPTGLLTSAPALFPINEFHNENIYLQKRGLK